MGVATRRAGVGRGLGREGGRDRGAISGTGLPFWPTGFWFGEGGIARPRRGVREPL